eukprot:6211751-Pleurochrysis_carterae.AAC.2
MPAALAVVRPVKHMRRASFAYSHLKPGAKLSAFIAIKRATNGILIGATTKLPSMRYIESWIRKWLPELRQTRLHQSLSDDIFPPTLMGCMMLLVGLARLWAAGHALRAALAALNQHAAIASLVR